MGVDVADLAGGDAGIVEGEPHRARRLAPIGARRRHVVGVVGASVARDLGIDPGAARERVLPLLEHQHRRPFAHHEPVPVLVERAGRAGGVVVASAHRSDDAEGGVRHRRERRLSAAPEHQVGAPAADRVERVSNGDRSRSAAHGVRRVRSREAELDGDVAARRPREDRESERRVDPARAVGAEGVDLRLGERDAPERRAHHCARPVGVPPPRRVEVGVGQSQPAARHGELREAVEAPGALRLQVVLGAEVGDLGGDPRAEWRRVEAGDLPYGGAPGREARPQSGRGCPDRRHGADPRDHYPALSVSHEPSANVLIPPSVREAMPRMNTGPITSLAASAPTSGHAGPCHA